jgi:hypothetical protein
MLDDDALEHRIDVKVNKDGIAYSLDGESIPYVPIGFSVVFLKYGSAKHSKSPMTRIAENLSIQRQLVPTLLSEVTRNPNSAIRHAEYRKRKLFFDVVGTSELPYQWLSGSEKVRVNLEFAIALSRLESRYRPTLLIIDGGLHVLDPEPFAFLLERLRSPELDFQTILTTVESNRNWEGWQTYILRATNSVVHVNPASV